MRSRTARAVAAALATTALALGSVAAGSGTAQAATGTTTHCHDYASPYFSSCDAPSGTGAQYTFNVDRYWFRGFSGSHLVWYMYQNVRMVCSSAVQTDATSWTVNPSYCVGPTAQ